MTVALAKPRKPLSRSTPMKRGPGPKRRKGIRKRSKKTEAKYEIRRELVARILAERTECEAGELLTSVFPMHSCGYFSEHVHEPHTRARGGDILDEANCLAVCFRCHEKIHHNPRIAHELGLLRASWED